MMERVTTPTVVNVSLPSANTEYSTTIPAGAKAVRLHVRDSTARLFYAFVAGVVATQSDKCMSIAAGEDRRLDVLMRQATTIYVASDKASNVFELEYWL